MTIKSDKWIKEMAEKGMIDPFEPVQVKTRVNCNECWCEFHAVKISNDGSNLVTGETGLGCYGECPNCGDYIVGPSLEQGLISYGVSSYGYDMRVSTEFKVFTPTYNAVIDPKAVDERAFVDVTEDVEKQGYCLVPPNSFALCRSVERFKIPENVLCVVLGKSSYARCGIVVNVTPLEPCLSDDSEILTADGWIPMADVQVGDRVLTRREDGVAEYQPVEAKQERPYQGNMLHFAGRSVDQLVTPDHKLFVWRRNSRQNSYEGMTIEAREVFGKHSYSFDRQVAFYGDALDDQIDVGGQTFPRPAFLRFLGCWLGDGSAYRAQDGGYVVKLAAVTKERKFDYYERVLKGMGIDNARRTDRGWQFYNKGLCRYLMRFGHAKEKFIDRRWMNMPPEDLGLLLDGLVESDGNRETMTFTTTSRQLADDVQELVFKSGAAAIVREIEEEINGHQFTAYKVRVCETHMAPKMPPKNHKLIPYDGMVYDVTVPNHVFFMRRNGKASWTGNCWEGYVTIEISNTTPLPAKVYAREGLCQVLFFESDEKCEVSYADRKGKYQDQPADIILPKL